MNTWGINARKEEGRIIDERKTPIGKNVPIYDQEDVTKVVHPPKPLGPQIPPIPQGPKAPLF